MLAAVLLTFAAVFMLITAIYLIIRARHSPAASLKQRLKRMSGDDRSEQHKETVKELFRDDTAVEQAINRLPLQGFVARLLEQSGTGMNTTLFTIFNILCFLLGFLILLFLKINIVVALLFGLATSLIPMTYLRFQCTQYKKKFEEQLPDALLMIARSLQAGHSLSGAVELVGDEMPDPAGRLFRMAYEQQKLGVRVIDALAYMPERINSMDLRFFITIIKMNSEIGGGLAEILEKLAETVRIRLQIRRQVQVLTAEGKLSGYILAALPFVVFAIFNAANPGYLKPFYTNDTCRYMLYGALVAQVVGFLMIRKIIDIRI